MFHVRFRLDTHTYTHTHRGTTGRRLLASDVRAFTGDLAKTTSWQAVSSSVLGVKRAVPKTFFCYGIMLEEHFSGSLGRFSLGGLVPVRSQLSRGGFGPAVLTGGPPALSDAQRFHVANAMFLKVGFFFSR